MMIYSHIIDGLYMSGANTLAYPDALRQHCITHLLKLFHTRELSQSINPVPNSPHLVSVFANVPQDFTIHDHPLSPGAAVSKPNFQKLTQQMDKWVMAGQRVLVMSHYGMCRAPVLMTAYIIAQRHFTLPDALRYLRAKYAYPTLTRDEAAWQSLLDCYRLPYTVVDIWRFLS